MRTSLLNQINFVPLNCRFRFPFRVFRVSELPSDSGCQEQSFAGLASYFVSATSLTATAGFLKPTCQAFSRDQDDYPCQLNR